MNQILLFDADGVLTLPEELFSNVYARSVGLDPESFEEFFRTDWAKIVTGKADLKQHISNNPGLWQWNGAPEDLLKFWFETEDVRNQELIELIENYRQRGIKCYLATEQEKYRGEYMKNVMFPGLFDGYFITAEIGVKKDNPEFYQKIIERIKAELPNLKPNEITFFDDSQTKIDCAKTVGINGVLYTGIESVLGII